MAKARRNVVVRGISGSLGILVFREMPDGSTYISTKQDFSHRELSERQIDHHSRFQEAARYARAAARLQPIYAQLARGTILSPYNIALSDWFHPPVIHCVERHGATVRVQASDNVCVARVVVTVLDEAGCVSEKGEAVMCQVPGAKCQEGWWEYVPGTEGRVRVEVWDLAGNQTIYD